MIKVDGTHVSVTGSKVDLAVDVITLLNTLTQKMDVFDRNDIDFFVDTAFLSNDELHEKVEHATIELIDNLFSHL